MRRHPIQCIIPPHMIEKIIQRGGPDLRRMALRLKDHSHFIRQRRNRALEPACVPWDEMPFSGVKPAILRVFDAAQSEKLPGRIVRQSGDPAAADGAVNEAYDGAEAVWNLYMEIFRRNSIDGRGMDLNSTIHYGEEFNNAFWDGSQMVYGDGDGRLFGPFTQDVDIIGHELTHGVTQCEAGLQYQFQSGALNESFSDVFGSLVKQYRAKQTAAQADWLIGEKVLLGGGYALRSLKAPGTAYLNHPILGNDPQPAAMSDYRILPAWQDNGGVHINSGIPNHAFYLAAMAIGGYAWEKTGWIWFRALTDYLGPKADFLRAARATVQAARDLYGAGGTEEKAVADAWIEVKVVRDEDQILHHRGVRRFEPVLRD